jgi:hypothetical protein
MQQGNGTVRFMLLRKLEEKNVQHKTPHSVPDDAWRVST